MLKEWVANRAPRIVYAVAASAYWLIHPDYANKIIYPAKGCWRVHALGGSYYTIRDNPERGSPTYQKQKFNRYTRDGFCTIKSNDTVVDVGAFLGEFSIPASQKGAEVLAIEPDGQTYCCLKAQTKTHEKVTTSNALPAERKMETTFNTSSDPTESSLLTPDSSPYQAISRQALPLDDILAEHDIDSVDYLKMDAEGAEPEVLRGLTKTPVECYAIDTGSERDGEMTTSEVVEILEGRGYKTVIERSGDQAVTFAKRVECISPQDTI